MRSRRVRNLAAAVDAELQLKVDKVDGEVSGDLTVVGGLEAGGLEAGALAVGGDIQDAPVTIEGALEPDSLVTPHQYRGFGPLADRTTIPVGAGFTKWNGGVLAPNGKIYAMSRTINPPSVLIIDPTANTTEQITAGFVDEGPLISRWFGGVLAKNGKIYGIPSNSGSVLIIDPKTNTVDTTTISGLGGGAETNKWSGGVLGLDGKIYGIPTRSDDVLIIDPETDTATTIPVPGLSVPGVDNKWYGGVLGPNGKIYGIPNSINRVLVIDPTAEPTAVQLLDSTTPGQLDDPATFKWYCGVLAPNGRIYGIPRNAADILVIDPQAGTITREAMGYTAGGSYGGGVLAQDGKIYAVPFSATTVLIIDPATETADQSTITGLTGASKWSGCVLAPNGKIYGIPSTDPSVLLIRTGTPTLPPWMLEAHFNKM
jgi:hypothetical protein